MAFHRILKPLTSPRFPPGRHHCGPIRPLSPAPHTPAETTASGGSGVSRHLEVDTIGVIIGPDLVFRDGQLQANPTARARSDKSLTGWRAAMATDAKGTEERLSRLSRNIYRTLMSRGMKSCWVFACDPELQAYLRQRLN